MRVRLMTGKYVACDTGSLDSWSGRLKVYSATLLDCRHAEV